MSVSVLESNKLSKTEIAIRAIKTITTYSPLLMFLFDSDPEPHSRIIKVPNSTKRIKNQSDRAREKYKHEHDEIKLSQLTSRLNNRYL